MSDNYCTIYAGKVAQAIMGLPMSRHVLFDVMCEHMTFARMSDCGQEVKKDDIINEAAIYADLTTRQSLSRAINDLCDRNLIHKESPQLFKVNPNFAYRGDGKMVAFIQRKWDMMYPLQNTGIYKDIPFC